jgi:hypothetical protein
LRKRTDGRQPLLGEECRDLFGTGQHEGLAEQVQSIDPLARQCGEGAVQFVG